MDLWIRSQDKEKLLKISGIQYQNCKLVENETVEANILIGFYSSYENEILGEYKTKERALEVLDEIYKLLIPKPIISTYNVEQAELLGGTTFIKPMLDDIKVESYTPYIYQMPEN